MLFFFCILGSNLFFPGHYVLLSKEVISPKYRQGFIGNSPGRDGETSLCTESLSPLQARPFPVDSLYSSWPPRAQSPLDQARASAWGGGGCAVAMYWGVWEGQPRSTCHIQLWACSYEKPASGQGSCEAIRGLAAGHLYFVTWTPWNWP